MKDRNMWKNWRNYRLDNPTFNPDLNELLKEGEDETLKGLSEGMLAAVQNLVPTLTNFGKMTSIMMNPKDPKKSEEENKFLESWIIEVSSVDIYSKVEKEIDMKPNITIKVGYKEVRLNKGDINKNINVTVERVRVTSE